MWVIYAFGSAFFAGMTSILVKCGLKKTNSTVATAIRTIIVLIMSFFMVLIVGSLKDIATVSAKNWVFLVLSGIATSASWLCYFRAIQLGDVNKVAPIDKSSTILTILLAFILLKEPVSWLQSVCVCMIAAGTFMMIEKKGRRHRHEHKQSVASLCGGIGGVCRAYVDSRQSRHFGG